jgi:hypothetical protein
VISGPETISAPAPDARALRNFKRSFPDVNNEKWNRQNGYYFVSFTKDKVKNKVVYTQHGQLDYALKVYGEDRLLPSIKSTVKSIYYDYAITNVQELSVNGKTIYLIKINKNDTWKNLRVSDGEFEEIENYSTVISPCR